MNTLAFVCYLIGLLLHVGAAVAFVLWRKEREDRHDDGFCSGHNVPTERGPELVRLIIRIGGQTIFDVPLTQLEDFCRHDGRHAEFHFTPDSKLTHNETMRGTA